MKTISVTLDGQDYNIDLEKAKELGLLQPTTTIRLGSVLRRKDSPHDYVLCLTDIQTYALISLYDGNRWQNSVTFVENVVLPNTHTFVNMDDFLLKMGLYPIEWELVGHISEYNKK